MGRIKKPTIFFGDFNSLSDSDSYDKEILVREAKKFIPVDPEERMNNLLRKKVIPYVKSIGFIDALESKNAQQSTIPTKSYRQGHSDIRIDYIFHTNDLKIVDAKTIRNKLTDISSDHYPISAVFEIK